jgi:PAS domain S-box-containing protein
MLEESKEKIPEKESKFVNDGGDGRYKTLFEQVNAAAFLTSFEGQILEANHKSCELFGYKHSELLRLSLNDIISGDKDWSHFKDEIAGRGGLNIETESICKDGSYIPVEISISLFKMVDKPMMFALLLDITDRKNAEKKLKESEKNFYGLFEYSTDGIFVLDARGNILEVNTKMCEMIDLTKINIIGKNLFSMDFLTAKSRPIVLNQFEQLLSDKRINNYKTQIKSKQDDLLDVEISSFFLTKKNRELDKFILIVRDITVRNETEQKLRWEHDLLKSLMDTIPDSVYFKDEQNRFVLVNNSKARHYNINPESMIGKTDFDFLPHDQAQQMFEDDNKILNTGESIIDKIEKITDSNGFERWISVTKVPRYNTEGDIIGTLGISRDVTEWKKLENIKTNEST